MAFQQVRRTLAAITATTLTLGGMIAANLTPTPELVPQAVAAEPKPAYATAVLSKLADGSGHGTSAQSFVNSQNGFVPGDDQPDDGIVSSGDTVEYEVRLSFTAAAKRTVTMNWNLQQAPMLAGDAGVSCVSGRLVTATRTNDGGCSYEVPAGAVETISQRFTLTARDTGGLAVTNQTPRLVVGRAGQSGGETTYRAAPVTVVSAPAADLVLDNGGWTSGNERKTSWTDTGSLSGSFTIHVTPLTYPGYSTTHGASTSGEWSTSVDVSQFPTSATFTLDDKPISRTGNLLRVEHQSGDHRIGWTIPAADPTVAGVKEGGMVAWDMAIQPDSTVFSTTPKDGSKPLLNMGVGGQPGSNQSRDTSTLDGRTGARSGYPYANNDWSRAIIDRPDIPQGQIYWKSLLKPYTPGSTLFDQSSRDYEQAMGETNASGSDVAQHTQIRTQLGMIAANVNGLTPGSHPLMSDEWDPTVQQYEGDLHVRQGDQELEENRDYTIQYTYDDPTGSTVAWKAGRPADTDHAVRSIRVQFNQNAGVTYGSGAGNVLVTFLTRTIASPAQGNVKADDLMRAKVESTGLGVSEGTDSDYVWIVAPKTPTTGITMNVQVSTSDNQSRQGDAQPGDQASYTVTPSIRDIQLSNTGMTPTVTITPPTGLLNITNDDPTWSMTRNPNGTLTFMLAADQGRVTPGLSTSGDATFPTIRWHGVTSNLATGTLTASATLTVDVDANGVVPAYPQVTSNTATAQFTMSTQTTESGLLTADQTRVEINDPVSFTFNLYAKGSGRSGTSDTVIHMPSNDDNRLLGENNSGLDGSWNEYDRGSSNYHGTWRLDQPVTLKTDNSTTTTVQYSTAVAWSDDPADYTWKPWGQLTDEEKGNVTAVRVISDFTNDDMPIAAANGTITLTPTGNMKDDQYNMWPGRTRFTDGHANGNLPWADKVNAVAGSIQGTVWWDRDENTLIGDDEEKIRGVEVSLWQIGDDGNKTGDAPLATTKTDAQGGYLFDLLHSGRYMTEVKRNEGETTSDGVQTKVTTYYDQQRDVSNTYSWNWQVKQHAKDTSDIVNLLIGQNQKNVNFGYSKPDPKATLDKTQVKTDCDAEKCTVNWDVKVTNDGKTTGRLPNGAVIETLSASDSHSLAIGSDGNTYAWGYNSDGQLGDGTTTTRSTPVKVKTPTGVTFTQVSAGNSHSLAIGSDGNTYAWGYNYDGELGDGTTTEQDTPVRVKAPDGVTFTQVSASYLHSLAIGSDGNAYAWGDNTSGRLGDGTTTERHTPVKVQMPTGVTFTQVSAYYQHSLAIGSDGNAYAWGTNWYGELGDGTSDYDRHAIPLRVQAPAGVTFTQISAGGSYSLAIGSDGNAYAWGWNNGGRLGDGTTTDRSTPVPVKMPNGVTFTQVRAGGGHSLSVGSDGNTYAWGGNEYGELGDGTTTYKTSPVQVQMPIGVTLMQVSAGSGYSLAIGSDGNAYAWGDNNYVRLGDGTATDRPTPIKVKMPAGVTVKPGIQTPSDDSTKSSGTSTFPQTSTLTDRMSSAVENVTATVGTVSRTPDQTIRFTQMSASTNFSLAIGSDSNTYAWGRNEYGQLGYGTTNDSSTPVRVKTPDGVTFTQVSAGDNYSLAIGSDGNTYAWGLNNYGQLGDGTPAFKSSTPVKVKTPAGVTFTQVSAGGSHSLALGSDGNTYAWGRSYEGQLGDDTTTSLYKSTPVRVKTPAGVTFTQVSAGDYHSLAIGSDGNTYAWGENNYGQLGASTITSRYTPVRVLAPAGITFTQISAGYYHSLALGSDGNTYAWGYNDEGELGDNTVISRYTPVRVLAPAGVTFTQISAGGQHSLAVGSDGNTYAWGWNGYGRLGDNTTHERYTPVRVLAPVNVPFTQISAGGAHSLALGSDGNTYAWGWNYNGRLGDGTTIQRPTPVKVKSIIPGTSVDPTAIPIDPTTETTAGSDTTRTYHLPYEVQPGGYVVYHFTGTIRRTDKDQIIHNQSWFDSPDTPYAGTPNARAEKVSIPNLPDDAKLDRTTTDIVSNKSCMTGSDYKSSDMQHWFSIGAEDQCDQVGFTVPAYVTTPVYGSVSGLYWRDVNRDSIRQDTETDRIGNQQVVLEDANGNQVATTTTDEHGVYRFDHLTLGTYKVRFSRVNRADFTNPDANDTDRTTDKSSTDSDATTDESDYGMGTPTITLTQAQPDKTNVDAGVLADQSWTSVMPFTGGWLLITLLLVGVGGLTAATILLRPRVTHSVSL